MEKEFLKRSQEVMNSYNNNEITITELCVNLSDIYDCIFDIPFYNVLVSTNRIEVSGDGIHYDYYVLIICYKIYEGACEFLINCDEYLLTIESKSVNKVSVHKIKRVDLPYIIFYTFSFIIDIAESVETIGVSNIKITITTKDF